MSTDFRSILGGASPNHMFRTENMTKDEIETIIYKTESAPVNIIIVSEIKVVLMDFQHSPPGIPLIEIISTCPQSNNECSDFTTDAVEDVQVTISNMPQHSFMNFAVDSVSVETVDVMCAICQFLDGKESHTGAVDNKHNVNNDRYQIIG